MFFAATKLFQAKDPHLRRMVYLCIKDICPGSDEVRSDCVPIIILCQRLAAQERPDPATATQLQQARGQRQQHGPQSDLAAAVMARRHVEPAVQFAAFRWQLQPNAATNGSKRAVLASLV